ncbi:MAG: hypothetical protein LUC88_04690 [Prevotella sp.]|nr:hypothetical protein [Prevotella sp.]
MTDTNLNDDSLELEDKLMTEAIETWLQCRSNLPTKSQVTMQPLMPEHKTTQEIIDDLQPMMPIDAMTVARVMKQHEYSMMTERDGSVKWAIWRDFDFTV